MTEQNQSETTTQPKKQRRSPNADKWGVKVMEQGFCMIPSLLLRAQQRLHLSPSQLAVLLQIIDHWWDAARKPYPEVGHYRQTWIGEEDGRPSGTCIYFLLGAGERSHWHTVDATEIWHHYAGAPLILSLSGTDTGPAEDHVLGPDLFQGQSPQIIVPPHHWQAARSTGDWTLVGCTVSPAFQFDGFTLAPPGFDIPRAG